MSKSKNNKGGKNGKKRSSAKPSRRQRKNKHESSSAAMKPVMVAEINDQTADGELLATPVKWEDSRRKPPQIIVTSGKAATVGDTVLIKINKEDATHFSAHVLKILPKQHLQTVLGVFQSTKRGGLLEPVKRKVRQEYFIDIDYNMGAKAGQLVVAEALPKQSNQKLGLPCAKVIEILGEMDNPKCYSLIAIHHNEIPVDFPVEAIAEAEAAEDPVMEQGRTDLRDIPLITIDGADARDFDDAVFAEPNGNGGWHCIVAIADVAHYVKPDSALDQEGLKRGNSTYFPDRVVPMLPEALSNGLCSLNPDVDRFCLAVHLYIDAEGKLTRHKFVRGLMRSHARMTYESCEEQWLKSKIQDLGEKPSIISNLYGAYHTLQKQRQERGALDLDLPEFQTHIGENGHIEKVSKRMRLDSHKLIEEFMVTANIAAAIECESHNLGGLYRVHEPPSADKVEELRSFLKTLRYSLNEAPSPKDFNGLLKKAKGQPEEMLINSTILRSQMQALYLPKNLGHFGLSLTHYAHFTSPIRRYADLVTHRAIISKIATPKKGEAPTADELASIADHISTTERRSMLAEREANDRYIAAYMAERGEAEFTGTITGIGNYGVFVTLEETGASGLVRISELGKDYYVYEEDLHALIGRDSGQRFQLGQKLVVAIKQADLQLGSLSFTLIAAQQAPSMELAPRPPRKRSRKGNNAHKSHKGKKSQPRKRKKK